MAASSTSTVAYSYIRFSSRQQAEGDSLRRQTEQAEAYCQRRGWTLDTSLTLRDLGVSAFRGDNALAGNLGKFLEQVKRGTVQTGSVLIVESFDRISRQGIDEGYEVVKRILKAGVRIVTLSPEREFDATATKSLSKGALEIQLILERAAEESETKSKRCAAAQAQKRKEARANGTVATAILPGWLTLRGGKIVEIPKRVAVVRSIFALASAGYGYHRIVKKLEGDPDNGIPAVPPFGKARHWCRSTLINMIRDRRVLGEYQPCKRTGKNSRVPDGEPIPNYYPAVITEAEWLAAQVRPMPKGGKRGRQGKHANLFVAGLLIDARDGGTYRQSHGKRYRVLRASKAIEGHGRDVSFSLPAFERGILRKLAEIKPHDILNGDHPPDETPALSAEKKRVEAELESAKTFMAQRGFSPAIGERITDLEARLVDINAELTEARVKQAHPASESWGEAQGLIGILDSATTPKDLMDRRLRLRAALSAIIDHIRLVIVRRGAWRFCAAQIWFAGGKRQRSYILAHKPPHSIHGHRTEEQTPEPVSFADVAAPDDLDLRKPEDARALEQFLAGLDLPSLK